MANPKYTLEVYRLDVTSGTFTRIDIITTFKNLNYFYGISRIGAASFELDVHDPKASKANLVRYANHIIIKRYGTIVWAGPITDIPNGEYTNIDGKFTIQCNTPLFHLNDRYTSAVQAYSSQEQTAILSNLITTTQAQSNGSLGITVGTMPTTGTNRQETYEYKPIAQALMEMYQKVGGPEFNFDINYSTVNGVQIFTGTTFNVYYPRMGAVRYDLPSLILGQNIKQIKVKTDKPIYNSSTALGAGTGENVITSTLNYVGSQQGYTRREVILSQKSISLPTTLSLYNTAYMNKASTENYLFDLELYQSIRPTFGDFNLGDSIFLTAQIGDSNSYFNFQDKEVRVIELAIKVDDQGAETITPKVQVLN